MKKTFLNKRTGLLTILAITAIIITIIIQVAVIYNNYLLTLNSYQQEVNSTLDDVYNKEMGSRFNLLAADSTMLKVTRTLPEGVVPKAVYEIKNNGPKNNIFAALGHVISDHVNNRDPVVLSVIDSLAVESLKNKKMNSDIYVQRVLMASDSILETYGEVTENTYFTVHSKKLQIGTGNQGLKLVLKNPQTDIFKRSLTLLVCSLLLAMLCIFGLIYLGRTLSYQRKMMAYKNEFFEQVAHELRRPISHVQMSVERVLKKMMIDPKMGKYLTIAVDSSKVMSSKLNMILALSMEKESVLRLNYSRFNVLEVVERLRFRFSEIIDKCNSITVESELQSVLVNADKEHIRQCIENFLDNSIKYSNEKVNITIKVEKLSTEEVAISVIDDGIGVVQEKIDNLFEKYSRENDSIEGFGIGLSYVKKIIKKHKGRVFAVSTLGKGSTFTIVIPI